MADDKRLEGQDRALDKDETILEPKNVSKKRKTGKTKKKAVQTRDKKEEIITVTKVEQDKEEPPSVSEQDNLVRETVEEKTKKIKEKTPTKNDAKQSNAKHKTEKAKAASHETTSQKSPSTTSTSSVLSTSTSSYLTEDAEDDEDVVEEVENAGDLDEMAREVEDSIPHELIEENDDDNLDSEECAPEDDLSFTMDEQNDEDFQEEDLSVAPEVENDIIENQTNLVMPDQVQVKVKKATFSATDTQTEFDPKLFRIRVLGGEDNQGSGAGPFTKGEGAIEENTQVQTNLEGAQVTVGEARRRVIPKTRPTQLPVAAIKIRNINGEIINLTTEIIKDKVIVQGIIHKQVFFVSADGVVRHFAENIPFSTFIDIPGADRGMNAQVHPVIEKILFHLSPDGLFVNQKIILEIFVKVTEFIQTSLTLGEGPLLLLPLVVGEGTKQTLVENIVDLDQPAIKIDEIRGELRNIEAEIIPDKVIIKELFINKSSILTPIIWLDIKRRKSHSVCL